MKYFNSIFHPKTSKEKETSSDHSQDHQPDQECDELEEVFQIPMVEFTERETRSVLRGNKKRFMESRNYNLMMMKKLFGWLSEEEVQDANWIVGQGKATIVFEKDGGIYTYIADKKNEDINLRVVDGKISYTVRINVTGDIIEQKGEYVDLSKLQNVEMLEKTLVQTIEKQVKQALEKSQNYFGVDYLGLGNELNRKDPKTYRSLNWTETYPQVPVNVVVNVKINTFGLAK